MASNNSNDDENGSNDGAGQPDGANDKSSEISAPKSTKAKKEKADLADLSKAAIRKLNLTKRFYSGELETLRKLDLKMGGQPWRVLRYERVIDPAEAILPLPQMSYVTPTTFRKHMRYLSKEFRVVPISEIVAALREKKEIPDRTVAITFDEGWMDGFLNAFSVLRELSLPASFFLPTAFIGTNDLFWPDKVALTFLEMKRAGLKIEPFDFFPSALKDRFYEISPEGEISFPLIFLMIDGLRQTSVQQRGVAVGFLGELLNSLGGQMPFNPSFLSWEEVRTMEQEGMEFGTLGHGHFSYRGLEEEDIADDLRISWQMLRDELRSPLPILSVPLGDFEGKAIPALEALEFRACLVEDIFDETAAFAEPFPIIRRISINELSASSQELFFCKMWDLPLAESDV